MKPIVDVVAGVIRRADGKILISLRPDNVDQGGLWEFPGGKREAWESAFYALQRELIEELDITIKGANRLLRLSYEYPSKIIDLDVWEVLRWEGDERGREGQRIEWVAPSDLRDYEFPAANKAIVAAAQLPQVKVR